MTISFRGAPTADEARFIARESVRPHFYLPFLDWIGLLFLVFGVLAFDLEAIRSGIGWLSAGITFIVVSAVLRWGNRRRFVGALQTWPVSGFVSSERLRVEAADEAIELPVSSVTVYPKHDDVVMFRASRDRLFWIFRSGFTSPEEWREARSLLDAAPRSGK